jgi:phage terminase large subunit-like protein
VFIGVDASFKHDSTAICVVSFDQSRQQVRLVTHKVFQPTFERPLDFELTVEAALLDMARSYQVQKCLFDPWQMQAVAQRLQKQGLPVEEFPQTSPNLTAASQNLFDLVESQGLVMYADEQMRLAISRAVAIETPRGCELASRTRRTGSTSSSAWPWPVMPPPKGRKNRSLIGPGRGLQVSPSVATR